MSKISRGHNGQIGKFWADLINLERTSLVLIVDLVRLKDLVRGTICEAIRLVFV